MTAPRNLPIKRAPVRRKERIQPWVSGGLRQKLRASAAAQNVTESSLTEAALTEYLDPERVDRDWLARRLDLLSQAVAQVHAGLERANARAERDMGLVLDAFGVFVRYVFLHATTKPGAEQEKIMEATYQTFLRLVRDPNRQSGHLREDPRGPGAGNAGSPASSANSGRR
jgi:hypothetical protein